jgi:aryl-alcohol dehydrogenase-like predicted oxidoreductase
VLLDFAPRRALTPSVYSLRRDATLGARCIRPSEGKGSLEEPLTVLADLQRHGLIRHIGLSNVTSAQVTECRRICDIVCVQSLYNLAERGDEALVRHLAEDRLRAWT